MASSLQLTEQEHGDLLLADVEPFLRALADALG
jgi:hypothetical protein